jgi:ABC-type sugar transport system ATPase subunit
VDARLAGFLGAANLLEARFADGWADTVLGRLQLRPDPTRAPALERGVVIVRPEQLRVSPGEESGDGLPGTVEQCLYYGHDALLHIRPAGPGDAAPLIARVRGEQALASGTAVLVSARGQVSAVAQATA